MKQKHEEIAEAIQKMAVKLLATSPTGEGMCLIGGFRYRFLDQSCRVSLDLDYHWPGDLEKKQSQVLSLFSKKLLPLVKERLGFDGNVSAATGPDAESSFVKTVDVAVWSADSVPGRITIPVDITRIMCIDKPVVRTVDGVVYLSASDTDMVESKVVAVFARLKVEERDIVDVFLFKDKIAADSAERLRRKFAELPLADSAIEATIKSINGNRSLHVRNIDGIVADQIDSSAAANIRKAGGGDMIFRQVMDLLKNLLRLAM